MNHTSNPEQCLDNNSDDDLECKVTPLDSNKIIPLLPLKDIVVFPHMIVPVFIGEDVCINSVEVALGSVSKQIFLSAFVAKEVADYDDGDNLKTLNNKYSKFDPPYDVYPTGTVCSIMRTRKLPDGRMKVLVQGLYRAQLKSIISKKHYPLVSTDRMNFRNTSSDVECNIEAMIRVVRDNLEKIVNLGKMLSPDILLIVEDVKDPSRLCDLIAANLGLKVSDAQNILRSKSAYESLSEVNSFICKEIEVYQMQQRIQSQAKEEIGKMQREHYLREQIRVLKSELGEQDVKDELDGFWQTLKELNLPKEADTEVKRHLKRLGRVPQDSSEAVLSRTYVDTMLSLPWHKTSTDNLELKKVSQVFDEDHYGLGSVKERILEYLAVKKLNSELNPPILCFVGPPGVGKTSLGRSIARAMNRQFARIALGGIRDDAEIRGHRKTYVGAYPGRVITAIQKAGFVNPVIMFDELDKISQDHRSDPASAMLEVLDPTQNHAFHDHYLAVPFDISKVLFIANANTLDTIPYALRDRLEIIHVNGYTFEEKICIAQDFLVPKQIKENGLNCKKISFTKPALEQLIQYYTKESGLRSLEKKIACVCRKQARIIAEDEENWQFINQTDKDKDKDKQSKTANENIGEYDKSKLNEFDDFDNNDSDDKKLKKFTSKNSFSKSKNKKIDNVKTKSKQKTSYIKIDPECVETMLGAPSYADNFFHIKPEVGVALGMAYTNFGGDILAIEVNIMHANSYSLTLTGHLGDVMKESASAALSYIKASQKKYLIPKGAFDNKEFHVHVPQGAISKDGPSAGVAITTALLSAVLHKAPRAKTCLTGEMTLHGKVLPVGGLKEKILAAQREGLDLAILPESNRSDYIHLPVSTKKRIKVKFVSSYSEVFDIIFIDGKKFKLGSEIMTINSKRVNGSEKAAS